MSNNPFAGRRYINLLRASTNMQDTSPEQQKSDNDRFAQKLGMKWVEDKELLGVSGSKTFNRHDLTELLRQRRLHKNYDVILVWDSARLTRGGATHSAMIRRDFARESVAIISSAETIPTGHFKDVIQTLIDTNNKMTTQRTACCVTRGLRAALENGRIAHHGGLPIGVDLQYLNGRGEPFLRLRALSGGRRCLISEPSGDVLKTIERGKHGVAAYTMNSDEKSRLVPGDPAVVRIIQEAFNLRYRDKWGFSRICDHIAAAGLYPLRSNFWRTTSVRDMLLNPVYLGWAYYFKMKTGLFYSASKSGLEEREINQDELEAKGRASVPRERRSVNDMLRIEHPQLQNLISDKEVRSAALQAINHNFQNWELRHDRVAVTNPNSQPRSPFFLRDVLRDKHHRQKLFGHTSGHKTSPCRYYNCNRVYDVKDQTPLRRGVRAEPIEQAVLAVLKNVLTHIPNMNQEMAKVASSLVANLPSVAEREALERDAKQIDDKMTELQIAFTAKELAK